MKNPDKKRAKQFAEGMRAAGKLAHQILNELEDQVVEGMSTWDIDILVHKMTSDAGAISAPYRYKSPTGVPFPAHCCTSVNNVICHGIPSKEVILKSGDILNIDVTPKLLGYHGDSSRMFSVGKVSFEDTRLIIVTLDALHAGIAACYPDCPVTVIGEAIEPIAKRHGFSIVSNFTAHGTGKTFHKPPTIFHCTIPASLASRIYPHGVPLLSPGTAFTIEPMLNAGDKENIELEDGWTIVTKDGSKSAQWEHTLLMTSSGVEILTGAQNASK